MQLIVNNTKKLGRNDPCPCGSGKKFKRCCLDKEVREKKALTDFHPANFRREMEGTLKKMAKIAENKNMSAKDLERYFVGRPMDEIDGEYKELGHNDAKVRAEDLLEQALEASSCRKAVKLAHQALALYPNLADAWILLGEHEANTPGTCLPYFEKAVEAGRADLGEEFFRNNEGHFWGMVESRPFMRAKAFLAQVLWDLGREDEAIANYQECLRLNPNDNQGLRYALTGWLIAKNRLDEAEEVLKRFKNDCGAMHVYNKALYLFARHGSESKKASKQLVAAIIENPHVPKYLSGKKKLPVESLGSYGIGTVEEAICYAEDGIVAWERTPGALEWLSNFA